MKKIMIVLAVLMLLPLSGLFAQAAAAAQPQSYTILSFDVGYLPGYDLGTNNYVTHSYFGFNVRLANPLTVGAAVIGANQFLKVKYDVLPALRAVVGYGAGNRADLGVEIIPFRNKVSGLAAEFKINLEYLWDTTNPIDEGILYFGLAVGVGI
jgi:hypothetical protein